MSPKKTGGTHKSRLGLNRPIDRRDFLNGLALSAMATWGGGVAPRNAFGAQIINGKAGQWGGNTPDAYIIGHALRDGAFDDPKLAARDTGEFYDVVVVGAGLSGLVAATALQRLAGRELKILLLENHALPGGAAKADVLNTATGPLLTAQGSIVSQVPTPGLAAPAEAMALMADVLPDVARYQVPHMDRGFSVVRPNPENGKLTLYQSLLDAPLAADVQSGYMSFLQEAGSLYADEDWRNVLTSLDDRSFKEYLTATGRSQSVYEWMVPELATFFGLPDQVSAAAVWRQYGGGPPEIRSLPGGNSAFVAGLLRCLWPELVKKESVIGAPLESIVDMDLLDAGTSNALRLQSTAVRIQHIGEPQNAKQVSVIYSRRGQLEQVRSRSVVMAGGAFITQYVIRDLPTPKVEALGRFIYAPIVWVNVALDNARALDAADPGFLTMLSGTRASLLVSYDKMNEHGWLPTRNPSRPVALGLSLPYFYAGQPARVQAARGRMEMLNTPFPVYEKWIREDLLTILGPYGFDPARDISAISVSRWGHGYVFPDIGFLTDGARQRAAQPFGRIAYANTDLDGFSHITGAMGQGYRAAQDILRML